jgi:Flp pilus assembly protein TadG
VAIRTLEPGAEPPPAVAGESRFAEIAVAAPLLLVLVLGALELGRGVWTRHTLTHAAREAARYAAVRSTASVSPATAAAVEARVKEGAIGIDAAALEVETTWTPANVPGATVRVDLRYKLRPITPFVPVGAIKLETFSQRVVEN